MLCQNCQKNVATVQVTELIENDSDDPEVREERLCEICAQSKDLPHAPVAKKSVTDILKLLPTLTLTEADVERTVEAIDKTLASASVTGAMLSMGKNLMLRGRK